MARADNRKVICKKAQRQKELLKLCIQTHIFVLKWKSSISNTKKFNLATWAKCPLVYDHCRLDCKSSELDNKNDLN